MTIQPGDILIRRGCVPGDVLFAIYRVDRVTSKMAIVTECDENGCPRDHHQDRTLLLRRIPRDFDIRHG